MALNLRLPACERCRLRKIKCDGKAPKCTSCDRAQSSCVLIDTVSQQRYSRQAVFELEEKLKKLETNSKTEQAVASNDAAAAAEHPFIGPGSGLGFLKYLFSTAEWVNAQADLMQHLNVRAVLPEAVVPTHGLPSKEFALEIVADYFEKPHVLHTFLARQSMYDTVERLYSNNGVQAETQDYYRLFMVLAIGSISKFREKQTDKMPFGYFKAAQKYIPLPKLGSIDGIQNILLLSRYASYCHVRCSIWDMSQLCMKQCIELGLHRRTRHLKRPFDEQMDRRIFWTCYVQDRYSSGMLGRPYAIADEVIDQPVPLLADDEDILTSHAETLDEVQPIPKSEPCEMAIFLFVIKLRRISSRIQKAFYSPPMQNNQKHVHQISDAGYAYNETQRLLCELSELQKKAPVFSKPRCLYEHSSWHEFFVSKDKLVLLRGAIGRMALSGLHPAKDLLHDCLRCATKVINLYVKLHSENFLTWTRSYFQILFTAGISIIFALSTLRLNQRKMDIPEVYASIYALPKCGSVLRRFVEEMPDASRFALLFEALRNKCIAEQESYSRVGSETWRVCRDSRQVDVSTSKSLINQGFAQSVNDKASPQSHSTLSMSEPTQADQSSATTSSNILSSDNWSFQQQDGQHAPQPNVHGSWTSTDQMQHGYSDVPGFSAPELPDFSDAFLGQMEAGVGEFAWGDPQADFMMWQEIFSELPGSHYR